MIYPRIRSFLVSLLTSHRQREEKFFSRLVTHVVTTRPIPPEIDTASQTEVTTSSTMEQPSVEGPLQTVNPSLLEKNPETSSHTLLRSRNPFDRRPDGDSRRDHSSMDVLHRARQMGMKIWALEKLQRMIATINDEDIASYHGHYTRSHNAAGGVGRGRGEADLSQVLRNELLNGPSDRDPSSVLKDLVMFKGPFIYVHDMDEKTRPVMVREYPKVARRQDGAWPQFRSAPLGKCPFIDEPPSKKEIDRERARQQAKEKKTVTKPPPQTQNEVKTVDPSEPTTEKRVLQDIEDEVDRRANQEEAMSATQQTEPQKVLPVRPASPRKSEESFVPPALSRTGPFHLGREPAASGVQPSNITSAIRSQMISSTAAVPGAKAGISKEVHELKRKVLEKSNGGVATGAVASLHRTTEAAGMLKATSGLSTRSIKNYPQEKLGNINEEDATQLEDGANKQREVSRKTTIQKKPKEKKREPKPGYCENCRDKFDDFEEVSGLMLS